jgi:DNA end-binding protein Ku
VERVTSAEDPDTVRDWSAEDRETARVWALAAEVHPDAETALVVPFVSASSSINECTIDTATGRTRLIRLGHNIQATIVIAEGRWRRACTTRRSHKPIVSSLNGASMARAIWTGALSFGLVNIPVEVHTAVRDSRPRFRLLHAKDRSPINFERVCQKEGHAVAWEDLVKGFEYEKGRFVVLTKEDFKTAALEKTKRIDILDFVKGEAIDDRFFDKPYYLTPGKGGDKAYALLREAIRESARIGIAKFILRDVQHLAAVEVIGEALVLSILRFADELVDVESLSFPSASQFKKTELDMATALVENLSDEWNPEKYSDDYRENLMRLIKAKLKGKPADLVSDEQPRDSNVVDLMERLRRSLEKTGKGTRGGTGKRTRKPARAGKRASRHAA